MISFTLTVLRKVLTFTVSTSDILNHWAHPYRIRIIIMNSAKDPIKTFITEFFVANYFCGKTPLQIFDMEQNKTVKRVVKKQKEKKV